jgi:aminoglycoside phosphotransferase (APT) family kinase protein
VIDAIVARVWPGGVDSVEPLGGGITNRNFKVVAGGDAFVLRIGGNDTELLGIDRDVENGASRAAAALGIAPEVIAFLEPEGFLVTRFVDGDVGRFGVGEVGTALRVLHAAPPIAGRFDAFRIVESYAEIAQEHGIEPPSAFREARETSRRIEAVLGDRPLVPCHNDLLAANFVHDGERLWIVDWEYAGMGDPAFDLANFAVNNGLDADGERDLLDAHGGGDERALILFRFMSDFREAMWGVVQQGVSELEFDFVAYADEHFERLERTGAEPRFRAALD